MVFNEVFGKFSVIFGLALFTALLPHSSRAGFFSSLAKFFGVSSGGISEDGSVYLIPRSQAASELSAVNAANRPPAIENSLDESPANFVQDDALVAPLNPLGAMPLSGAGTSGGQIFLYTIRPGDTIGSVAKSFGVSANTILWANSIADVRSLKTGDQILILPISGVRHEVKKGDTIAAVAKKYRATVEDIQQFNGLAISEELLPGAIIIVPNGELRESSPAGSNLPTGNLFANLPVYQGYYLRPIIAGRRSRGIHGFNGVDLASSCGLSVLASADGTVLITRPSGWNGGYGRYLVITHANDTQTLYAHLKELNIAPGESVRRGQVIAAIGSSGNSTGCHVHFEVRGAKNPF